MAERLEIAPLRTFDLTAVNALVRELNQRLRRVSELFERGKTLQTDLDAGGFRLTNVGAAEREDDALILGQLEEELERIEERRAREITSEGEEEGLAGDASGKAGKRKTSKGRRAVDDEILAFLEDAVATAAPPKVADAGSVGTTTDPIAFALSDHTHAGVNLDAAQTITGLKTFNVGAGPDFAVAHTTKIVGLNADLLDGLDSTAFVRIGPNGAANRVAYFTDASTVDGATGLLWDAANTRLGIGTPSPDRPLVVIGDNNNGAISTTTSSPTGRAAISVQNDLGHFVQIDARGSLIGGTLWGLSLADLLYVRSQGSVFGIGTSDAFALVFGTNNSERARVTSAGTLLINTTTEPSGVALAVSGTAQITTVRGSDAAGGSLILQSTSHATKGSIVFSTNARFDEATERFQIGTSGIAAYNVDKNLGSNPGFYVRNQSTSDGRAAITFTAERGSSKTYSVGIDPSGGSAKSWGIRDETAAGLPIRWSIDTNGNMLLDSQSVGGDRFAAIRNDDNTNTNSKAFLQCRTGGSNSGDPFVRFTITGGSPADWAIGIDNSDGDKWKLSQSSILGVNDTITADANRRVAIGLASGGTATARLHVSEATLNNEVFRLESVATNDDPDYVVRQGRVTTTDATATTLATLAIAASRTYLIEARIVARRTDGTAGVADDGAVYIRRAMVTTKAGTVTVHTVQDALTQEDQAAWDATLTVSGTNILVQVTGAADTTITWHATVIIQDVGS